MKRTATAFWKGTINEGEGHLTTQSGILSKTLYSFKSRVQDGIGTNPEELIAAAHAGCFTMSVDMQLSQKGFIPESLETQATVELDMSSLSITHIHLEIKAKVSNLTHEEFQKIANDAELTCIISKALRVPISMNAVLE